MKILFAADKHQYTAFALQELMRLAENTWADVTILGVLPRSHEQRATPGAAMVADDPLLAALESYRQTFLSHWPPGESPYEKTEVSAEWISLGPGLWEQLLVVRGARKELKVQVRFGDPAGEILKAAREEHCDLIVMGCGGITPCRWQETPNVPQRVTDEAEISVLLVKETQPVKHIYTCMDESNVSQESLEMVNQMASIHGATVDLVGLTKAGGIKADIYPWLNATYEYYRDKGVPVDMRFREIDQFETFLRQEVQDGMLALWLGKKSLLERFFQKKDSIGSFVSTCRTSVLVLR